MTEQQKTKDKNSVTFVLVGLSAGGAERVAVNLINYWVKNGRQVKLITRLFKTDDFYSVPATVERFELGGGGETKNKIIGLLKNINYVRKLRKALKKTSTDVVISFMTRTNIQTIIASFKLNKQVIISERNDPTKQNHGWPWHWLRRKLYKYADIITANSSVALNEMSSYVPEGKLLLVKNPVLIPENKAETVSSNLILNVGRLVPAKNQELLVHAFVNISETFSEWKLKIVGEGEEREKLNNLILAKRLTDKIELPGLIHDVDSVYRSASIFVLTSKFEGTPNALLEAMSYGLPSVISDNLPGAVKLVENVNCGLIFNHNDPEDLESKIEYLIKNPDARKKMGQAAFDKSKEFALEDVWETWNSILIGKSE